MSALVLFAAAMFTVCPGAAPPDPTITFAQENITAVTGQVLSLETVAGRSRQSTAIAIPALLGLAALAGRGGRAR
jgi:hypothetical protein